MKFQYLTKENAVYANALFNEALQANEMPYKEFQNVEAFYDFFYCPKDEKTQIITYVEENGKAFASGCYVMGQDRVYITMVVTKKEERRKNLGTEILSKLEEELLKISKVKRAEIVFFNPMTLSWYIPDKNGADHPNSPGIDVSSDAYLFFKNCGYRDYATQNSYYIDLAKYHVPSSISNIIEELEKEHITVEYFDSKKHYGMEEMINKFENPLWNRDILGEITKEEESRPILIVSHERKAIGFTGPLDMEESGRGYFAGIGVDNDYRGKGIAKVLFCKLCVALQEMGASFMTLFTGEMNQARNIYEAAGFKIVKTWSDMKKEWKDI